MTIAALPADAFDITAFAQGSKRVGGQAAVLAPGSGERAHIAPGSAAEEFFGGHQVAGLLKNRQLFAIDESGLEPEFLRRDYGLHGGLDLALEVMALVDHVGGFLSPVLGQAGVDFVEDAKDLIGIDGAEGEVVVGVAAVGEVETTQQAGVK